MIALDELKQKINGSLLILQTVAAFTTTPKDDEVVEFFRYIFQDTQTIDRAYALWIKTKQGVKP